MLATLSMTILLAQSAVGGGWSHHGREAGRCGVCGVPSARVMSLVMKLQSHPREGEREDAADDLREVNWRCHPEAAEALAAALLRDPEEDVREEAAESLARMGACSPSVHAALAFAASNDPDDDTRRWARRGLASIAGRCAGPCKVCGPAVAYPETAPPRLEPRSGLIYEANPLPPASEIPAPVPGSSPFAPQPAPTRPAPGPAERVAPAPGLDSPPPPPVPVGPYGTAY